jgi:hypothetical protein
VILNTFIRIAIGLIAGVLMANVRTQNGEAHLIAFALFKMLRFLAVAAAILVLFAADRASAQQAIGKVSRIQGEASATRGAAPGPARTLALNASVLLEDIILTGDAARLELTLSDNTRLTLGEKTRLTLERYVFDPAAATMKLEVVGVLRFVSGQLSKLAHADVGVTTPAASIGVRGTDFWAGPIDNQALGVLLIEGAVSVTNPAGQQILNQPGQGTNIAAVGAAPGAVTFWPADKVNRALAAVAFP